MGKNYKNTRRFEIKGVKINKKGANVKQCWTKNDNDVSSVHISIVRLRSQMITKRATQN